MKSTPAAQVLAASEALDELLLIHEALESVLETKIKVSELVDAKDLYNTFSTQRNSTDKSIRGDVNCIRFIFETSLDLMGWIRGTVNRADVGTKPNSTLTETVVLILATGKFNIDLSSLETRSHNKSLG